MNIRHGKGRTKYGPGVDILLTGNELAQAVLDYIAARGVDVTGPRTVTVGGELCTSARVYVDPSGHVVTATGEALSGRGPTQQKAEDR